MKKNFLPQKGNYRGLFVYQKAKCIYGITFFFAHLIGLMGLVSCSSGGDDAVGQAAVLAEGIGNSPPHESDEVLFQVFVEEHTRNLHQNRPVLSVEGLEDDGLKPRCVYLLCDVLPDEMEAVVPKRLVTVLYHGR